MSAPSVLSPGDRTAMLDAVAAFAARSIAPLTGRPEIPVPPDALTALDAAARAAGVLPDPAQAGWALWEPATPLELSLAMLRVLGRASAGVAYRFHLAALSMRVARDLGLDPGTTLVAWEGTGSFGKGALAALLHGETTAAAADLFPVPGQPAYFFAVPEGRQRIAVPDVSLGWRVQPREAVTLEHEPHTHGLCETPFVKLTLHEAGVPVTSPRGAQPLIDLLGAHALGAVAIGSGAAESAKTKALAYAHERHQGGVMLHEHAAIRLLIAESSVACDAVEAMLTACEAPADAASLARVFRIRAAAHPLLCSAANACLQVFGGYGYMQDYGMEKIVRDCNTLRLVGASPTELRLHAAGEELAAWRL